MSVLVMIFAASDACGLTHYEFLPEWHTVNKEMYNQNLLSCQECSSKEMPSKIGVKHA
jgi:hypothetical protein